MKLAEGLEGWLDEPSQDLREVPAKLRIRGWIHGARVVHVSANGYATTLTCHRARPDVASVFPGRPETCGFEADLVLPPGAVKLVVEAELADGRRVRCFERALNVRTAAPGTAGFAVAAARKAFTAWREGRLELSPGRVRTHLANLRRELAETPPAPPPAPTVPLEAAKAVVTSHAHAVLAELLSSGARLALPRPEKPEISVLLVLFNRAELTLRCLRTLTESGLPPLEIVIVDNASTDATGALLDRLDGATIVRNAQNEGFTLAVNEAAKLARGRTILLLNNDTELLPGSLETALSTLDSAPDVGAVAGKLILPDGTLQEAGSIVWRDGSCLGYGRGDSPQAAAYAFRRDVDYGSGAFLLTPRALWERLGGFDPDYAPAYYEDADYCVRVWKAGFRVVYEPRAALLHFEFASSASKERAIRMQTERREIFVRKHGPWLAAKHAPAPETVLAARSPGRGPRVLVLDDRVPHSWLGSGFPRALALLRTLVREGCEVTFLPLSFPVERAADVYAEVPREVEILTETRLSDLLDARAGHYHAIVASRPHNLQRLRATGRAHPPVVYDAEALFADRDASRNLLNGEKTDPAARNAELDLARGAAAVLCVNAAESQAFRSAGVTNLFEAGHVVAPNPGPESLATRRGLLFAGALRDAESPNVESLHWFALDVLPRLSETLTVVGETTLPDVLALAGPRLKLVGRVASLEAAYAEARVFVAPTRFAAGIPYKVHHAAAHGVPVVATSLLAKQLGWKDGEELLVADDGESFARACRRLLEDDALWRRIREGALAAVRRDCSEEAFTQAVRAALELALQRRP